MAVHHGSCHCGAVRFRVDVDINALGECNCSICEKKGIVHVPVTDDRFALLAGKDALQRYTFGSGEASHWFCRTCGIHPFGRPRMDPSRYTVNARCLDDWDTLDGNLPIRSFNGRQHPRDSDANGG